jgi:catechol 2,3-dioxygenase-like lactoylglutathione lyase family enzyme
VTEDAPVGPREELGAQLVAEFEVRDLDRCVAFYEALGFAVARRTPGFAALRVGGAYLFLDRRADLAATVEPRRVNVRVVVDDLQAAWAKARAAGAEVVRPPADLGYGLEDFVVRDPEGFGVRFARIAEG